ncbi:MAG TPA: ABC transporter substrate-binding protein [Thermomicrobiales bacterium]|nr:ABC transporter substrate-binding protein [Thermomicrobiales bacterium]HRA46452.1 ABC transporter substrate-binding protein [Thermomicrobiales bacterium]
MSRSVTTQTIPNPVLDRRSLLAMGSGLALASLLTHAASAQDATPDATPATANGMQPDGTWAFTDDRGITVTLDKMPERIVADINVAAALWDFGLRPVGIFGWNILSATEIAGGAGGNLDLSTVEIVSEFGTDQIDVEKLAGLDPDLIVSSVFAPEYGVWSINPDAQANVETIAPIVTISGIIRADKALEHTAVLAAALGVDLDSDEIVTQRTGYEAALQAYKDAIAANQGITAIFIYASPQNLWVANPDSAADVMLYRDLGLIVPHLDVAAGEYWLQLSLEETTKFPTDMVFNSDRSEILTLADLQAQPTYALHPAIKAGQVYSWSQDVTGSYLGMARVLNATAADVASAKKGVGTFQQ